MKVENKDLRDRTKAFAIRVICMFSWLKFHNSSFILAAKRCV